MIYLITFACYGSHMHGNNSGCTAIIPALSIPRTTFLELRFWRRIPCGAPGRSTAWLNLPIAWTKVRRDAVLEAIQEVCRCRGWSLLAAHVRSNHVHTVAEAETPPEQMMNAFKTYASRRLNRMALDEPNRKRWARHGSTRWLWKPQHVSAAIQYIVAEQGNALSVFKSHEP